MVELADKATRPVLGSTLKLAGLPRSCDMTISRPSRDSTGTLPTLLHAELRSIQSSLLLHGQRPHASRIVNEAAHRMGARMGLPAEWDVVERMAGTDAARLLKKARLSRASKAKLLEEEIMRRIPQERAHWN